MSEERHGSGPGGAAGAEPGAADRGLAELVRTRASRPAAPPALRARVEAALAAEIEAIGRAGGGRGAPAAAGPGRPLRRQPPVSRARWWAPAFAAGLAALLVAGVSALVWVGYPAAERRLAADAVRSVLAEYRRLEASGPADPVQSAAELSARVSAALRVPVRLGEPRASGVRLAGLAPTSLFGAPGVAVFIAVDGRIATLSLVPSGRSVPRDGQVRLGRRRLFMAAEGGERTIIWRQGPLICALTGELPEPRLTALFLAIRPGLEVGGA